MTLIPAALARPLAPLTRPVAVLAGPAVRLFLTSATILFVELLLIRWIPANVRYVGLFSNFLLMASFLGIGAGHPARARRAADPDRSPFAPLLLAVVLLVTRAQLNVQLADAERDLLRARQQSHSADANFLVLPLIVCSSRSSWRAGAAARPAPDARCRRCVPTRSTSPARWPASLAFTVLSAAGTQPFLWFVIVGILLSALGLGVGLSRRSLVTGAARWSVVLVIAPTRRSQR